MKGWKQSCFVEVEARQVLSRSSTFLDLVGLSSARIPNLRRIRGSRLDNTKVDEKNISTNTDLEICTTRLLSSTSSGIAIAIVAEVVTRKRTRRGDWFVEVRERGS